MLVGSSIEQKSLPAVEVTLAARQDVAIMHESVSEGIAFSRHPNAWGLMNDDRRLRQDSACAVAHIHMSCRESNVAFFREASVARPLRRACLPEPWLESEVLLLAPYQRHDFS